MHTPIRPFLAAVALVIFSACSQMPSKGNKAEIEQALRSQDAQMKVASDARDLEKVVSYFAADAVMLVSGQASIGADAIKHSVEGMLKDPAFKEDWSASRYEIADSGDLAAAYGTATGTFTDKQGKVASFKNSYVTVFRKQPDGAWKTVFDSNVEIP